MKVDIPESVKSDVPPTTWGKILSTTPVVMAVVATALAGLSSSEMTRAQYSRSYAAQLQAKAGDQWALYQAKKLRAAMQRTTLDLLHASGAGGELSVANAIAAARAAAPVDAAGDAAAASQQLGAIVASPAGADAVELLAAGRTPPLPTAEPVDQRIVAAREALAAQAGDDEIARRVQSVDDAALTASVATARARLAAADAAMKPFTRTVDQLDAALETLRIHADPSAPVIGGAYRTFTAARARSTAARYDAEASLNQDVAELYELQVRRSNLDADRHRGRSQQFFYGMLGAQLGVIIATFAVAARRRSVLWSIAAAAGLIAVTFAGYVYIFV